jgi:hypothetical protein
VARSISFGLISARPLQRAAQVEAAHVGQDDIQQHEVGPAAAQHLECLGPAGGGQHGVVVRSQVLGQEVDDARFVVDHEHG